MKHCRKCSVKLIVGKTWYSSLALRRNYICIDCCKESQRQWRKSNPKKAREQWRRHHAAHRKQRVEYSRKWRKEHPKEKAEAARRYYETHHEVRREYSRQWYRTHQTERAEYGRQWLKANPEKNREKSRRRRAREANAIVGPVDELAIYERDKICIYCGIDEDLTIDHLIPFARGGPHIQDNLAVACRRCNSAKGTKTYDEFQYELRDLSNLGR